MEEVYYILVMFGIVLLGYFWFFSTQLKKLDMKAIEYEKRLGAVEHILDNALDVISKLTANLQKMDEELNTAREAMTEWSEAGKMARKNEEDFNEGLNNILNFQPNVKHKGEKN